MNNLVLNDYVDLDDQAARKSYIIKTLIAGVVLATVYTYAPLFISYMPKTPYEILRKVTLLGFIAIMAYLLVHFAKTTKLFKQPIKQGKVKIATGIFLFVFGIFMLLRLLDFFKMMNLSPEKIITAAIFALMAGVIEELLCRGLLFNLFLAIFNKSKYFLVWASLCSSLFFGLFHFVNLTHQPLKSTLGQIAFAIALGMIFCYFRIITNNVIWGIVIHTYIDFSPQILTNNTGTKNIGLSVIIPIYLMILLLVLICIYIYNRHYNIVEEK